MDTTRSRAIITMTPDYWEQAKTEISSADPIMTVIIAKYRGESLRCREDSFATLARSIAGQQISVKAAVFCFTILSTCSKGAGSHIALENS